MADSITGTPNSEKNGTKFIIGLTSVIAVLSTATEVLDKAGTIIPPAQKGIGLWIALGAAVVGGIAQIVYTISRTLVKMKVLSPADAQKAGVPDAPPVTPAAPKV